MSAHTTPIRWQDGSDAQEAAKCFRLAKSLEEAARVFQSLGMADASSRAEALSFAAKTRGLNQVAPEVIAEVLREGQ